MNSIEALLGLFFLAGSNLNPGDPGLNNLQALPEVENLPDAVIIKATSFGCTKKRHFRIISSNSGNLRAIRIKQDRCHRDPRIVEFRYSHKQMGLEPSKPLTGSRIAGN